MFHVPFSYYILSLIHSSCKISKSSSYYNNIWFYISSNVILRHSVDWLNSNVQTELLNVVEVTRIIGFYTEMKILDFLITIYIFQLNCKLFLRCSSVLDVKQFADRIAIVLITIKLKISEILKDTVKRNIFILTTFWVILKSKLFIWTYTSYAKSNNRYSSLKYLK